MNHDEEKKSIYKLLINQATFNSDTNQLYLTKNKYKRLRPTLKILLYDERKKHIDSVLAELIEEGIIKEDHIAMSSQLTHVPAYIFPIQDLEKYRIPNNDMLFYIARVRNSFATRIYAYLYNKYEQCQNNYEFTCDELRQILKWPDIRSSNNLIEINIISLACEGIIKFEQLSNSHKLLKFVAARED